MINALTAKMAAGMETNMNLTPVTAMFATNSRLGNTMISGFLYLFIEVTGKGAILAYTNDKHRGDEAAANAAHRTLQVRFVHESIAEKHSIMTAPLIAFLFLPRHKNVTMRTMLRAGLAYIGMEECVDVLVILVLARFGVHLTRERPAFTVRDAVFYGLMVACNAAGVIIASMALGIKD